MVTIKQALSQLPEGQRGDIEAVLKTHIRFSHREVPLETARNVWADDVFKTVEQQEVKGHLHDSLRRLAEEYPRHVRVLVDRYGLVEEPLTPREIGYRLGLSTSRIRQLERAALYKLSELSIIPELSIYFKENS